MSNEDYNVVLNKFNENKPFLRQHMANVKQDGRYTVLHNRVAWDACKFLLGADFISYQYGQGLNDKHITTGLVKALKTALKDTKVNSY